MALPSGLQVDIEFTAGVWTNVSQYVPLRQGVSIRFGRTDSYGAPQVATASLRLDNFDGRFTPKNSSSPYYPNVQPRRRVRVSYSSGAAPRFVGYIKQWLPVIDGDQHYVAISATDRLDVLSRSILKSAMRETLESSGVVAYYPLADSGTIDATASSLSSVAEAITGYTYPLNVSPLGSTTLATAQWDGDPVRPQDGGQSLALYIPYSGANSSVAFTTPLPVGFSTDTVTLAAWVWFDRGAGSVSFTQASVGLLLPGDSLMSATVNIDGTNQLLASFKSGAASTAVSATASTTLTALTPHFVVVTATRSTATITTYLDGISLGSTVGSGQAASSFTQMFLSMTNASSGSTLAARFSDVMVFNTVLSSGQILDLYNAGANGFAGELTGARIARLLGWVGLSGADYNLATGANYVGPASTADVSVAQAVQDTADAEGGGAVVYVDVDGKVRFNDSTYRNTITPALTLDAEDDLDGGSWQPVFDDLERVNDVTYSRDGGASARYIDAASIAAIGTVSESVTFNAYLDGQLLPAAQWRLNTSTPQMRIPSVSVDLMTAANAATLYTALASVTIGSLLRVSGLPVTANVLPTTYIDGYVEGWSEQITDSQYLVTFDLSPFIPRHLLGNTTVGRLLGTTQTLTSTITSGATSMSLTTSAGPVLTTSAGDYPLYLQIDEEIVSVSSVPGGASPQTLTITRGQLGTLAAAHTAGATVTVVAGVLTV